MKKKVLFMIDALGCGGAEKSLVSLLPLLDYDKMEVDLMMIKRGGIFECYIPRNVNIIDYPAPSSLKSRIGQLANSLAYRIYRKRGINRHPAETLWGCIGWALPNFKKAYDVAIAYQQGFPTYYISKKVTAHKKIAWVNVDLMKARYRPSFNRSFYNIFTNVVTVSDALNKLTIEDNFTTADKTSVVYDILNVDLIRKMAKDSVDMSYDGVKIVTTGRLTPPKNHILAIETAKILKDNGIKFHWWFVGGGAEYSKIMNKAREIGVDSNITITGETPNPYPYMLAADIYVQPSIFEGFCLTLTEARILHRPVVTTNFPAAYNQIINGNNGLIVEMDKNSLAEAIQKVINDDGLKQRLIEGTKHEVNITAQTESKKVNNLILD